MKRTVILIALLVPVMGSVSAESTVSENKTWSETFDVKRNAPTLKVSNIWGEVRVRPGKSGEITVSAKELRSAPSQKLFDRSFESIKLTTEASNDGVSMRVGDSDRRWNKMNACNGCRVEYQFDITVPVDAIIDVSTVLDGSVDVSGIVGPVTANNVNGSIKLDDIHNCEAVRSVNGGINIGYSKAPTQDCDLETINGNVTLNVPVSTNLDVAVDLFNGEVTSDFAVETFKQSATVEKVSKGGSNKFRIKQISGVRIGADGPVYSISSMNGDVRIRQNK